MVRYYVTGGLPLAGKVSTSGAKNAVLPLMAAGLLFSQGLSLMNVPALADVKVMLELLRLLGADITEDIDELTIRPGGDLSTLIPDHLATRLRASVLLLGPLLARAGQVTLPLPGGDLIGRRPITTHLRALEAMGAQVRDTETGYIIEGPLTGADIYLEEASVTATENILMAAVLARGITTIRHAACEEHVRVLAETLRDGGVEISGVGTSTLFIQGTGGKLLPQATRVVVPPDDLEAGTFAIAALLTHGKITLDPYPSGPLRPLTEKLREIGAQLTEHSPEIMTIERQQKQLDSFTLKVAPAPGFPTDLQPLMTVLATQTNGVSLIHDWMYERRFGYVEQLEHFGAKITSCDPHRILVAGPVPLTGQRILSPDIRAGIAFVLAGLVARGITTIDHAEIIERGYADIVRRLTGLGAQITREVVT